MAKVEYPPGQKDGTNASSTISFPIIHPATAYGIT